MSYKRTAAKLSENLSELLKRDIVISPNEIDEFNVVSAGSEKATGIVTPFANSIVKAIGLKSGAAVVEAPCKKLARAFAKAITKFDGNIGKVPDIGRMRILIEKPEDIIELRKFFLGNNPQYINKRLGVIKDQHPKTNITVREFEDFYYVPSSTGRIAVHIGLDIKVPGFKNAIPFEIQVIHKDMQKAEDFTRDNYENVQLIERRTISEGRLKFDGTPDFTDKELQEIKNYNDSSKARYSGDASRYGLSDLKRPDLARRDARLHHQLQLVA